MPPEEEVLTAPPEQGVVEETTSKETLPPAKADETPQTPAVAQVEDDKPKPQVEAVQRAKPSDFHRFRQKINSLEEMVKSQNQLMQEFLASVKNQKSPETAAPSEFDKDKFFTDPKTVLSAREKVLLDKIEALDTRIKSFEEGNQKSAAQKQEQEALEKLFPNQDGQNLSLEERMESQAERMDKLNKLLKSMPVLDKAFSFDPMGSINLILEKLDAEPAKNPTVLPKKLMGGAKGGSGAPSNLSPKEQKLAELRRMSKEMEVNEELRFDEKHVARRTQLMDEIAKLER